MLINILIIILSILLFYQIFLANSKFYNIIEGLKMKKPKPLPKSKPIIPSKTFTKPKSPSNFKSYNTQNPNNIMILAQQNSGNIDILKKQMENLMPINTKFLDLTGKVNNLEKQIESLIKSQEQYNDQISSVKV